MEEATSLLSKKEQLILDNQMEIAWLERQIEQRKQDYESFATMKRTVEEFNDDQIEEQVQHCLERVDSLRVSMDIMTQFNLSKDRMGINLDDNHYSVAAQYPQHNDDFRNTEALQIQGFLMKRDKLVVEEMQLLDQLANIQKQVAHLHSQTITKYQENQQLWTRLGTTQQRVERQAAQEPLIQSQAQAQSVSSSQHTTEKAIEKLHDVLNRLEIAKNVLIGLILESDIDWASHRKWSRVMIQLGTEEDD
ncbi:hypothetical protein BCR42DRAFT_196555 [Absidia repens]|uniref:Centromere protein H C-terminal domain-containing protein n=1 Tax=Absidia repens TaxID=90262 RepID=A0A1X2ISZ4_9FUNG|nr:hypothetical protein BCR42DRAFT_196555 [Absidia repens]